MLLGTYTLSNKGYRSKKSDMSINEKKKVWVVGHKNPDTDSICAAIAYANLKIRQTGIDTRQNVPVN